ncbi:hypothetical protein EJ05DRAFT_476761 [Pseudovirgaria hyperparasitica]|uniref:Aminoglycoside phosphotransferase domain-containing protein n=1 Tax=Pseudovirgaria hyperparasitica TaxID=470096 RepID=A0A6A6W6B9_9PEZI|nr:uncharacterized protein EJ05DRAFT_476761 [Pseudovirgaria hyperparasitica]KAF2757510.1 hypothetical protein EJ05DRAFT_476761 [Pseudovirgaria hyperparasitica]
MPMWTCDAARCSKPAVRSGDCMLCNRHLCSSHVQTPFHGCPAWEDAERYDPAAQEAEKREMEALFARIDTDALAAHASALRDGMRCSIPALEYDRARRSAVMGGMNYHVDVVFEDGVVWLARIRRVNATSPPAALRDYILRSEVATMRFLAGTAVPAPRVFDFVPEGRGSVGYMLVEKMAGTALRWSLAAPAQRRKIVEQLADVFIELRKYPFEEMGCLGTAASSRVGAFARESLADFTGSRMAPLGPYSALQDYHAASIRLILDLILREEMYAQNPIDAYLVHRFLLDLVPSVLPAQDGHFYLKHADDKGDHILVDSEYNITAIIDWEWAYTAPEAIAFNSPIGLLPVSEFYDGLNTLGEEEEMLAGILESRGAPSLAQAVRDGRLQHRFAFCCGYDLVADWNGFLGLFKGLRDAVRVDQGLEWGEWRQVALERYRGDEGLERLLSKAGGVETGNR